MERKDKEVAALRKLLRDEVKSHDDEIEQLRSSTRQKVTSLKIELEKRDAELMESLARNEARDKTTDNRQEVVVDNLKMAKQINQFRREQDEKEAQLESVSRQLNDEKKMNEQITERLDQYIRKGEEDAVFTELELMRKEKELCEVRFHRLESQVHSQGTELLRIKKEREVITKRLHDAERESGNATRSAANLESETNEIMKTAAELEQRAEAAEIGMNELKKKLLLMTEDNRRLEQTVDEQKVTQCETDREKLQVEAKLRELQEGKT